MRKFYYVFDANEVDKWSFCPVCGEEILDVFAGDYRGHIECLGGGDCDIDFGIKYKDVNDNAEH